MSKIHYFQRYSQPENAATNNTLQLISKICEYSSYKASELFSDIFSEALYVGLQIEQQKKFSDSIPDAYIMQQGFKIVVEAKIDTAVSDSQIYNHAKCLSGDAGKFILLITKIKTSREQEQRIRDKLASNNISFASITYKDLCEKVKKLFNDYEEEILHIVEDYELYCSEVNLIDQSEHMMRIVPCGDSYILNQKYAIYYTPKDRGYSKHTYLGIYKEKSVNTFFKIDSIIQMNFEDEAFTKVTLEGRDTDDYNSRIKDIIVEAKKVCGHNIGNGHIFFCGIQTHATNYRKISPGGIMGARMHNMKERIGEFTTCEDLAEKMKNVTWK